MRDVLDAQWNGCADIWFNTSVLLGIVVWLKFTTIKLEYRICNLSRIWLFQVEYDFKYYKMEMAADVQLLILSEGKSNILPADLVLPFQPSSVDTTEAVAAEALEAWRWYLATLRSLPNSIEPELQKVRVSSLPYKHVLSYSLTLGRNYTLTRNWTHLRFSLLGPHKWWF